MIPNFEPDDLFEPGHYAGVRRPWDVAETLPGWCYTSPRFYERERERIFFRHWSCIGHESRVPEPGSYLAFDFIGVPLIVLRGADHEYPRLCQFLPAPRLANRGSRRRRLHAAAMPLSQLDLRARRQPVCDPDARGERGLQKGRSRAQAHPARIVGGADVDQLQSRRPVIARPSGRPARAHPAVAGRADGLRRSQDLSGQGQLEALCREFQRRLSRAVRAQDDVEPQIRVAPRFSRPGGQYRQLPDALHAFSRDARGDGRRQGIARARPAARAQDRHIFPRACMPTA